MANNPVYCITRIENELIWKINLCPTACNCGATYITKNANQQSNPDAIPSTQESKVMDHILTSIPTSVSSYTQENLKPQATFPI